MHRYGMKQLADGCESNDFCKALHPSSDGHGPAGQKLLILVGIPQALQSWDGMGIALLSYESGWSRPSPCRFSGTPEHFQASTYRISSGIFLRLQTAGKSIQWKAIRACLRATAGLQPSSRVVRYALDLSHWGKMLSEK